MRVGTITLISNSRYYKDVELTLKTFRALLYQGGLNWESKQMHPDTERMQDGVRWESPFSRLSPMKTLQWAASSVYMTSAS